MRFRGRPVAVAASCVSALLAPRLASASPALDLAGAVGGNGGVQAVVSGPSAASTYFNPALLTEANEDLLVGVAFISEQLRVSVDARSGGDVPLSVAGRDIVGSDGTPIPNDSVPTQWLRSGCPAGTTPGTCPPPGFAARPRQGVGSGMTRAFAVVGIVRHLIRDRLSLGFYAMLPVGSFTSARAFLPDEREALFTNSLYPELYGDRLTAISLVPGAAVKIVPALSLGVGFSLGVKNAAQSATYVRDATNYDALIINNDVSTSVSASPTLGARWQPLSRLRLSTAAYAPESFTIDTTIVASLPNGASSTTTRHDVFDWMPWRLALGVETDLLSGADQALSVTASGNYAFWSKYEDRHGQTPRDYGPDLAWKDTLSGSLGARHRIGHFREFIDLRYVPSPVPQQIGRSNYVDNTRLGLALGSDVKLEPGPLKLVVGLQLFGDRLLSRHHVKDDARVVDELPDDAIFSTGDPVPEAAGLQTNNPGWPGFGSKGWVFGGAISIAVPL